MLVTKFGLGFAPSTPLAEARGARPIPWIAPVTSDVDSDFPISERDRREADARENRATHSPNEDIP